MIIKLKIKKVIYISNKKRKYQLLNILKRISVLKIQQAFRKYRTYWINKDYESRTNNTVDKFYNITTLLGKNKDEIESVYFYKNNKYFYDVRELYKHILNSNKNPYTNLSMPKYTIKQVKRIIYYLKKDYSNYTELENEDVMTNKNTITSLKTDLFLKIDRFIGVSNMNKFNKFSECDLYEYIEDLFSYNLIKSLFKSELILKKINKLYQDYVIERNNSEDDIQYEKDMMNDRFIFNYYILKILHNIININDLMQSTRALIMNEIIADIQL
jgi:hypothetical protein